MALLGKLGSSYFYNSDFQNALGYFRKSLEMQQKIQEKPNIGIGETLNNIGECYRMLCDDYLAK